MPKHALPEPMYINDTPPGARLTDPPTSHEAADLVTHRELVETRVLNLLRRRPMTDAELTAEYKGLFTVTGADDSIRKRRPDLKRKGFVKNSGVTVKPFLRRTQIVWAVA